MMSIKFSENCTTFILPTLAQVNQGARELLYPDKIVIVTADLAVLAHSGW
jgi:hypothetical protein